jgi:hypothetical protein
LTVFRALLTASQTADGGLGYDPTQAAARMIVTS